MPRIERQEVDGESDQSQHVGFSSATTTDEENVLREGLQNSHHVASLNAVLRETLGLELVPDKQEMSINVLEVSKQADSKAPSSP
jgi:hypothetical protein